MRLATANLLHGMSLADGRCDARRLDAALASLDADVLALQEVDWALPRSDGALQARAVATATGSRWWRFVPALRGVPGTRRGWTAGEGPGWGEDDGTAAGDPGEEPGYGIALLSRLPVREWSVHRFPPAPVGLPLAVPAPPRLRPGYVPDEPRAAVAAVVETAAGPLTVVTTHLSFVPGFNAAQLRSLARWVRRLPGPAVVAGDLNLPGRVPARLTRWRDLVKAPTYPSPAPKAQIDHVLAVRSAGGQVEGSGRAVRLTVSDHLALVVDLDVA